jgi:hypothetical protein
LDKPLFARLCVTLMISHLHQRCTPRACTRGALLASALEAHSSRLHQRRTPFACTRGVRACIRGLRQRHTRACTKGTLFAPAPEAHSRLYQRRTTRACTRGALLAPMPVPHLLRLHEVTHLCWGHTCTGGESPATQFLILSVDHPLLLYSCTDRLFQ